MKVAMVLVGLFAVGCVVRNPAAEARAAKEDEHQRRLFVQAERQRADEARTAAIRTNQADTIARGREARAELATHREEARANDCAESRVARASQLEAALVARRQKDDLLGWEYQHCKQVDASVAVRRVVQDARGEYHTVEGRDRAVDRVCDAPLPSAISTQRANMLSAPAPSASLKNRECREWDVAESETFRAFWSEGNPWAR